MFDVCRKQAVAAAGVRRRFFRPSADNAHQNWKRIATPRASRRVQRRSTGNSVIRRMPRQRPRPPTKLPFEMNKFDYCLTEEKKRQLFVSSSCCFYRLFVAGMQQHSSLAVAAALPSMFSANSTNIVITTGSCSWRISGYEPGGVGRQRRWKIEESDKGQKKGRDEGSTKGRMRVLLFANQTADRTRNCRCVYSRRLTNVRPPARRRLRL
jgi:hypothetical protein